MSHRILSTLSLLTLIASAAACSHGSSPTEPADVTAPSVSASTAASTAITGKRHGADDPAGDDRGGQAGGGADDPAGDDRGRRNGGQGADDPAGDRHGGQPRPARGVEFSGRVSKVDGSTLTLASGVRVAVNAQTQWNARGDLKSLDQVATAVAAGARVRAEGRGTRNADGSLAAQTIKAERGR